MDRTLILSLGLALALSACASPQPAQLESSSTNCKAEIQSFVATATGQNVALADDLFLTSNTLLLEPSTALKLSGRVLGKPVAFQLKKQGNQCWIEGQNQKTKLEHCQCKTP
ncbi:hypothetical protein NT239_06160 [Chitinibacter sp. SCUT-21]|uniref:hypothetical protein n=1 Tax=Chitinibacter sp. SCUT-21 TaxID=2970891 RepID=UPI0035A5DC47